MPPSASTRTALLRPDLTGTTTVTAAADAAVWTSLEPFEQRGRRVATMWAAIGRTLEEERPLGGGEDEYLALHRWLRDLEADAFTALIGTPQAYAWVRGTQGVLARRLRDGSDDGELAEQVEGAKAILLGAALFTGREVGFERPFLPAPPVVLPLTDRVLLGTRPVGGVQRGDVVGPDGEPVPPSDLVEVPRLPTRHGAIRLSPFVLEASSIESKERATVRAYGLEGHEGGTSTIIRSFALLEAHAPEAHRQIVATIDTIALHDPAESGRSQATLSDVPGTFTIPCSPNAWTNVECIVHEYFHNRLFALEEVGPVFTDPRDEAGGGEGIYSPWRVEVRPVKGLLHSAYVFAPVAEFWLDVWRRGHADDDQLAYALDDVIRHRLQLRMGVEMLRQRGGFTPWGTTILDALDRRVAAFDEACGAAGVPSDATAMSTTLDGTVRPLVWQDRPRVTVRENVRANIARADHNGDTRSLGITV